MFISDIFKPKNINIEIKSQNKTDLFEELVDFLVKTEALNNKNEILKALWEREKKMTTGIAPHIAIPHTHIKNLGKTIGVLGISKEGIEYDSLDKKPAQLIMMLIGDDSDAVEHLNILKNIAMLLNIPDFYSKLINSKSPLEANEIINKFEIFLKKP
jgi:nitrogen PTS system EIIA component